MPQFPNASVTLRTRPSHRVLHRTSNAPASGELLSDQAVLGEGSTDLVGGTTDGAFLYRLCK